MFLSSTLMNIVKVKLDKCVGASLIIARHLSKELRHRKNLWDSVNLVGINMRGKQGNGFSKYCKIECNALFSLTNSSALEDH